MEGDYMKHVMKYVAFVCIFSSAGLILPSSSCSYIIDDKTLTVTAKGSNDTAISGSITKGTDAEGTYANFNGSSYINVGNLPRIDDITSGVHIRFKATWNIFGNWSRIFDCGRSSAVSSFFVSNQSTISTLYVGMHDAANSNKGDTALAGVLTLNQIEEWDITIASNANGNAVTMIDIRDGNKTYTPARTSSSALVAVDRPLCYIGKSLSPDALFKGKIYYLKVETLGSRISLIDFDASKMQ